jgi:hypothetical protein
VYYDFPMPLFLVTAPESAAMSPYEETIKTIFADNFIKISPTVWAVSSPGIAKDVALKITGEPKPGSATLIVVAVSGYWGIAQNSVWEWFASKISSTNGPK